jgi:hypothetical protein
VSLAVNGSENMELPSSVTSDFVKETEVIASCPAGDNVSSVYDRPYDFK